jgi:opacity protein-like surface antigen
VSGGLGLTRVSPENAVYSSETNFSLSIGGGVKLPLSEKIALRLEGRWYGTVVDGSGGLLCVNGACAINFSGNLYVQIEALAGLSMEF